MSYIIDIYPGVISQILSIYPGENGITMNCFRNKRIQKYDSLKKKENFKIILRKY